MLRQKSRRGFWKFLKKSKKVKFSDSISIPKMYTFIYITIRPISLKVMAFSIFQSFLVETSLKEQPLSMEDPWSGSWNLLRKWNGCDINKWDIFRKAFENIIWKVLLLKV